MLFFYAFFKKTQANKSGRFGVEHLASAHRLVRLDEVDDVIWHLIVASPRDVLHLGAMLCSSLKTSDVLEVKAAEALAPGMVWTDVNVSVSGIIWCF